MCFNWILHNKIVCRAFLSTQQFSISSDIWITQPSLLSPSVQGYVSNDLCVTFGTRGSAILKWSLYCQLILWVHVVNISISSLIVQTTFLKVTATCTVIIALLIWGLIESFRSNLYDIAPNIPTHRLFIDLWNWITTKSFDMLFWFYCLSL